MKHKVSVVWLRNELRLNDNKVIERAVEDGFPLLVVYIFDQEELAKLDIEDSRISFIYDRLSMMHRELSGSLYVKGAIVLEEWRFILETYHVHAVYAAEDYRPEGVARDKKVAALCTVYGVAFCLLKDRVIFAKDEIVKKDQKPYLVFTPYKRQWLRKFQELKVIVKCELEPDFIDCNFVLPSLMSLGFKRGRQCVESIDWGAMDGYDNARDYPFISGGTKLGPHLRYGTVSIRELVEVVKVKNEVLLSELIWREFFVQILYHFPASANANFKPQYDFIAWRNNEQEFLLWTKGLTGYPLVDAGMRQLNQSGYMHNRVRMVAASFLCKHLLIDWRWGEAYFSSKLLDYEQASNVGNWQWAAGTGCDAAPYFRVFHPVRQQEKFDPDFMYIKQWVPEYGTSAYVEPMVDHVSARERALACYKHGLSQKLH